MRTSAWAHLPNAAHIDAILADVQARPDVWTTDWSVPWLIASDRVRHARESSFWHGMYGNMVRSTVTGKICDAAWGTIEALVIWPESAAMLDLTPDALRTIISTCDGNVKHQAVLLLPAVIARSTP